MKKIVICADGTWNKPDQLDREIRKPSNVVKTARGILPEDGDGIVQVVFYDEGVGSSNWLSDKVLGGVSGVGINQNIIDCYRFLSHNYFEGDEIFMFGFSRGAFTVRSLAGFLGKVGLLKKQDIFFLTEAFQFYRHPSKPQTIYNNETGRKEKMSLARFREVYKIRSLKIKFIGVWDTVGALGIPVGLFQKAFGKKHEFHDTDLGSNIEHAYHALAIDEKRKPFIPTLWNIRPGSSQVLKQMWFAGVHTNIGGGYENDGLANIALDWLLDKARQLGLAFDQNFLSYYKPWHLHELRNSFKPPFSWLGEYQRPICEGEDTNEEVHESAIRRFEASEIKNQSIYRPDNLQKYLRNREKNE